MHLVAEKGEIPLHQFGARLFVRVLGGIRGGQALLLGAHGRAALARVKHLGNVADEVIPHLLG